MYTQPIGTGRPDPDELLKAVRQAEDKRGFLKIFLGAAAGVGKTYAMLEEAHEQKRRGTDIVIGYIETHKRAETQQLVVGLERIPLRSMVYRGSTLLELDVSAIIARAPSVVLVDELAHTNATGSTHAKRWQDIQEILSAGISVFTAVNIQHLESLNDVVAQITGVLVRETVPDNFFEHADEIELIDIPPAELQNRLKEGKVYSAERAEQALIGFFKTNNLTALRELSLRRTADSVDAEIQRQRVQAGSNEPWYTRERIVVCIAPNRLASKIVRAAARMASANHAELMALYIESDRQTRRGAEDHIHAQQALELAEELGIEVVHLYSHDIVSEIANFARRRNASLIVVGKPIKARWKELLFGSVVDELVRVSGEIDVHVMTGSAEPVINPPKRDSEGEVFTLPGMVMMSIGLVFATAISFAIQPFFGIANVAMVYVLVVGLAATKCNRIESGLMSLASVLAFNFCFVEPRFTFAVTDVRYLLLFGVMLTIGLVISSLAHRLREQLRQSSERERRTSGLYSLSRLLAAGKSKVEISRSAAKEISNVFGGETALFLLTEGHLELVVPSLSAFEKAANEQAVSQWVADHREAAGLGTSTLPGATALYLPLQGAEACVGVMAFKPLTGGLSQAQRQSLDTFVNSLGTALERTYLAQQSNDAKVAAETERIRSTLLSSISHDLRTPLTSITGAASSLVEGHGNARDLSQTILSESIRLNQQIQNLLDMTRLQSGNVDLKLAWQSPQELVASAIEKANAALAARKVEVNSLGSVGLFQADGLLIEKALLNLLENAGKFSDVDEPIRVTIFAENANVVFLVADTGPGIPPEQLGRVFSPGFHGDTGGFGLGLAIVDAITRMHGGRCSATNSSSGAVFRIEFPRPEQQPEVPVG